MNQNDPFNNIYKKFSNKAYIMENILSDFTTGFKKGLESTKTGTAPWAMDNSKQEKIPKVGKENPPSVNQIIATSKSNGKYIKAKVLTKMDSKGQWEIELINDDPNSENYYYYSDKYPHGIICSPETLKELHRLPQNVKTPAQVYYNIEGPYTDLKVGFDTPYPNWSDYKQLLKNY